MGNKTSHLQVDVNSKFGKDELCLLDSMFQDLARRSPGKTIDKATFLQLFNVPGMLGERLFHVFDTYVCMCVRVCERVGGVGGTYSVFVCSCALCGPL